MLITVLLFLVATSSMYGQTVYTDEDFTTLHSGVWYRSTELSMSEIFEDTALPNSMPLSQIIEKLKQKGYKAQAGLYAYNVLVIRSNTKAFFCKSREGSILQKDGEWYGLNDMIYTGPNAPKVTVLRPVIKE